MLIAGRVVNYAHAIRQSRVRNFSAFRRRSPSRIKVNAMEWTQWLPVLAGAIAFLGIWGAIQYRLGRLEARMDGLERRHEEAKAENVRMHEEAKAENVRLHEETRAEIRREIRLILQVVREHTHADGSPAFTLVPVDGD